ncbi:hypothetical protein ACRQ5Q_17880 [Bradyrhizobium sp. PMVTL-01]|uniref:hypothetical protein n=1 Tax=Bradyrhizobium sp. PMVTL-01 TaxID=3434999 RepID=UPI003F71B740
MPTPKDKEMNALARAAKQAYERSKESRTDFIASTFELAAVLRKARDKLRSDQAFCTWINKAGLRSISKDDRAALLKIGDNVKAARAYFHENEDAWSWRLCAQSVSQAAKPASRWLPMKVTEETRNIVAPYYDTTKEDPVNSIRPPSLPKAQDPVNISPICPQPRAVAAIEAMIDVAASTITAAVAAYWRTRSGEHPTPSSDQVREAAQWLDMLADALEGDIDQ